jgi:hypothetical protein
MLFGDSDWIYLVQVRVQLPSLLIMVMNFLVPLKAGNFLTKQITVIF